MRWIIGLVICLASSSLPPGAVAGDKKSPMPEEWIRRLDDRSYRVRQAAAHAIEALGPEALPALRRAASHPDPTVRRQIEEWIKKFEPAAALVPTKITMHLTQRPGREAIAELAKQSGYAIKLPDMHGHGETLQTFELQNVPFWEAFDKICLQARYQQPEFYDGTALQLGPSDTTAPFVSYHGSIRFVLTSLSYSLTRYLDLMRVPRDGPMQRTGGEMLFLTFTVDAEPRLRLVAVERIKITQAEDDRGTSLSREQFSGRIPAGAVFVNDLFPYRQSSRQSVVLYPASSGATSLKRLRGIVELSLGHEPTGRLISDNIMTVKQLHYEVGQIKVNVRRGKGIGETDFHLRFAVEGPDAVAWMERNYLFELADAAGKKYPQACEASSVSTNGKVEMALRYQIDPAHPPVKLTQKLWKSAPLEVPFEFRDVPLP